MSAAPPPPPPPPVPGPYGSSGAGQYGSPGADAHSAAGLAPYGSSGNGPYAADPHTGPHPNSGSRTGTSGGGIGSFFRALFDLRFEQFVALKFSAIIYVILIAYFTLAWLVAIVVGIIAASQGSGGLLILLPALFLGWIPALMCILLSRVGLEFLTAGIRTAINTGKLVGR